MHQKWAAIAIVALAAALLGNHLVAARLPDAVSLTAAPENGAGLSEIRPEALMADEAGAASDPSVTPPQVLTHVVASGETLSGIANQYGTDVTTIKSLNSISDDRSLRVGAQLRVLTVQGVLHKIVSGDTLWDLARTYRVTVTAIREANPDLQNNALQLGKEIVLPGAKPTVVRQAVASRGSSRSSSSSNAAGSGLGFRWPVSGHITSGFGRRWGKLHAGLDIGVPSGTAVKAAAAGTVTYAGWATGYGYLVKLKHSGGYETRYGHNSQLLVKVGQQVAKGQTVSLSGSTGFSTGPHLHFEVRKNGTALNPLTVLP